MENPKLITKFPGKCYKCGDELPQNTAVEYDPKFKRISHVGECSETKALLKRTEPTSFKNHTEKVIEAGKSAKGGFTKSTLKSWGIEWPPPKGWRKDLEKNDKLKDFPIA